MCEACLLVMGLVPLWSNSSIISIAAPAPMCLPVAPLCTHAKIPCAHINGALARRVNRAYGLLVP